MSRKSDCLCEGAGKMLKYCVYCGVDQTAEGGGEMLKYCGYCRVGETAGRRGEMLKYCVFVKLIRLQVRKGRDAEILCMCWVDQTTGKREIVKYFVCYQVDTGTTEMVTFCVYCRVEQTTGRRELLKYSVLLEGRAGKNDSDDSTVYQVFDMNPFDILEKKIKRHKQNKHKKAYIHGFEECGSVFIVGDWNSRFMGMGKSNVINSDFHVKCR